jgi:hypothetical protein
MKKIFQRVCLGILTFLVVAAMAHAQSAIAPGTVLEGFVLDKNNKKHPMVVRIASMDKTTGSLAGDVSWPSLNSVHRIEGMLFGNTVAFKEVSYIKRGSAHLNCEYAFIIDGGFLDGRWLEPGRDRGIVQLTIK